MKYKEASRFKRESIIKYVQENARYIGGEGGLSECDEEPYAIFYKGEPYWGESPRDLVLQIMEEEK
jgi:hypothetical protein